jgi:hypothetical protein
MPSCIDELKKRMEEEKINKYNKNKLKMNYKADIIKKKKKRKKKKKHQQTQET